MIEEEMRFFQIEITVNYLYLERRKKLGYFKLFKK